MPINDLKLIALNPIQGFRLDVNCTALRSFLVELDNFTIDEQVGYIKNVGVPYSAMIFSGNKSVHTLVTLATDLPDKKTYGHYARWMLNILGLADQNTKNPSRSIRIPGHEREPGKVQRLLDLRGAVTLESLLEWLSEFKHLEPQYKVRDQSSFDPESRYVTGVPFWVLAQLRDGLNFGRLGGRNNTWYAIACAFAKAGYASSDMERYLEPYFHAEPDFTHSEWRAILRSSANRF